MKVLRVKKETIFTLDRLQGRFNITLEELGLRETDKGRFEHVVEVFEAMNIPREPLNVPG